MRRLVSLLLVSSCAVGASLLGGACSTHDDHPADPGPAGGPVKGPVDTHCGGKKQATSEAACRPPKSDAGPGDSATDSGSDAATDAASETATDAGTDTTPFDEDAPHTHDALPDGAPSGEYGATQFNADGDDDQCKYHASFTVDPVRQGQDIYFTITATTTIDGKPFKAARPRLEVYLDETHPAPNTDQKATEGPDGTYKVGPVRFDHGGRWTVRIHFRDECSDGAESPHGHVAFFIDVPELASHTH